MKPINTFIIDDSMNLEREKWMLENKQTSWSCWTRCIRRSYSIMTNSTKMGSSKAKEYSNAKIMEGKGENSSFQAIETKSADKCTIKKKGVMDLSTFCM